MGLGYIYFNLPLWMHGPELEAALTRYERVRIAVFQGTQPLSALEEIAVGPQLQRLHDEIGQKAQSYPTIVQEPIAIADMLEYTGSCSVIILERYHGSSRVAFILNKIDDIWKVSFMADNYKAGFTGTLPLWPC